MATIELKDITKEYRSDEIYYSGFEKYQLKNRH